MSSGAVQVSCTLTSSAALRRTAGPLSQSLQPRFCGSTCNLSGASIMGAGALGCTPPMGKIKRGAL
eukprot:3422953-Alexandrium_andersonii.AAC.1